MILLGKDSMKLDYRLLVIFSILVFLGMIVNVAFAQWDAINSGYAVTTDYHGVGVLPGTLVTATAGTTDTDVENVTFLWKYPNETIVYTEANVPVWSNGTMWDGKLIYYANSSYMPDVLGDWGVQALFIGKNGKTKANHNDVVMIRATSLNVIPDFPVVGTAGTLVSMFLGLSLFLHKKKR
jgi:hypothetical protein